MAAYLTGKKLGTQQWYATRNRPLTGCTMLHTSEGVMDTIGPDTGAEALAEFIRTRTTAGSYHDVADADSSIHLIEYAHGAFHDATGSNNWALSLSFACHTIDWARMTPEKRRGFLWQGALRFLAQQQWRKANRAPLTRLRYITKAQSDAGESGFCCHGWRDPSRRTDPGTTPAAQFPFDEWLAVCAQALAQHMPDHPDAAGDDMPLTSQDIAKIMDWPFDVVDGKPRTYGAFLKSIPAFLQNATGGDLRLLVRMQQEQAQQIAGLNATITELVSTLGKVAAGDDLDAEALVARIGQRVEDAMAKTVQVQVSVEPPTAR